MADHAINRLAAVQMTSGAEVEANLLETSRLLHQAASQGARLIALPENFACMPLREADRLKVAEGLDDGPIQKFLSRHALTLGVWIVGGTIPIKIRDEPRVAAACLVYDKEGRRVARYDKIHLFDVSVPGRDESYRESQSMIAGDEVVAVDTPLGRMGLSVCYDLRFPELYRDLVERGCDFFVVPSAFTAATGRAHWEVLLRARAIENLCHVVAPAQSGIHRNGRETHGDSMIVDHWGVVLRRLPRGTGVVVAEIDLDKQRAARERFPVLTHRRLPPRPVMSRPVSPRKKQRDE